LRVQRLAGFIGIDVIKDEERLPAVFIENK
jgi:hypothetical protein